MDSPVRQFDKLPPHSVDAEMCLLASMMLAGDMAKLVFSKIRASVSQHSFFQADHQIYFGVICDLHDRGRSIDSLIVREELIRRQLWEEVGGKDYLAQILNTVPSSAHYADYANIVREKSMLRQMIALCNESLQLAYAPASEDRAEDVLNDLASRAAKVAAAGKGDDVYRISDVVADVLRRRTQTEVLRIPTGIRDLDAVIGGLRKGGKTIVGGKPGMGKSMLIKQVMTNLSASGHKVGLITVEEGRHKVAENILSNASGVINNRIAFGTASEIEWNEIEGAAQTIKDHPFFVVDSARKLSRIVAMANVLVAQFGCEVIAVDHLHIIDGETNEHREREISKISAELKWVWKDLNVCGIEGAQLNRKDGRERPTLASLRDSGSLEQDGDTVLLLHREDYYRKIEGGAPDNVLEVIVGKNKDGATGTVPVYFREEIQTICDLKPNQIETPFD